MICATPGSGQPGFRIKRGGEDSRAPPGSLCWPRADGRRLILRKLQDIRDDFAFLDDWEDRYRYVIELGREMPEFPESARNDANKVRGCVSQVWIEDGLESGRIRLRGDSDSHLVKGLVAIALALYDGKTPAEALDVDALAIFRELGLEQHLTPQRSNGVRAMFERIRSDAAALAA